MTKAKDETPRAIVGSIIQNGRFYNAGDEEALAAVLPASDIARHLEKGTLSGDWGGQPAADVAAAEETETEEETDSEEEEGLPTLADLPDHLAGIDTADDVKALRKSDKRKGAKPMYAARLAELKEG